MPVPATIGATVAETEDYGWLTSPAAAELLSVAAVDQQPLVAQVAQLRAKCSPERTHLVLQQVELRKRARAKFAAADRMFFTTPGLEQATDEIVAAYKAQRFQGRKGVVDLCAGIGGDLLALGQLCNATAVDRDPVMALIARANAATVSDTGRQSIEVFAADVAEIDVGQWSAWHIDPDRRPHGRRTTRVEFHEPGPEIMERLLDRNPHAAIKLAPAAELPPTWAERAELEWISRGGECRQLVAWFGELAPDIGMHRATVLGANGRQPRTIVGTAGENQTIANRIERYLFEPDAAVLAAKLSGCLAGEHNLAAIAPGVAYWTGSEPVSDAALSCFEVQEVFPFRVKAVKSLLRSRNIGQLEIKKRTVKIDPAELRRELKLQGDESATLLLAGIGKSVTAILAQRVR